MKYSWKGLKDRNKHKNRIKRSGQARLVSVKNIKRNIPTTWRWARGDQWKGSWFSRYQIHKHALVSQGNSAKELHSLDTECTYTRVTRLKSGKKDFKWCQMHEYTKWSSEGTQCEGGKGIHPATILRPFSIKPLLPTSADTYTHHGCGIWHQYLSFPYSDQI